MRMEDAANAAASGAQTVQALMNEGMGSWCGLARFDPLYLLYYENVVFFWIFLSNAVEE